MDKRIREISRASGDIKNLLMLSEECSELSKACTKMIRSKCGEKDIYEDMAAENLVEEIADVEICIDAIKCAFVNLVPKIEERKEEKTNRAYLRAFLGQGVDK